MFELLCLGGINVFKHKLEKNDRLDFTLLERQKIILRNLLSDKPTYLTYSPGLGWTIKPNGFRKDRGYRANSKGIRGDSEYGQFPSEGIIRLSAFGDSFTHSADVQNKFTWEEKIMLLNPHLEVLNFGVDGYGLDQAFLRYAQDGVQFNSHIVLIGFHTEDLRRNVSVFRPFLFSWTEIPLTKPRFKLRNKNLSLIKNPIQNLAEYTLLLKNDQNTLCKISKNDYWFQLKYGFVDFHFLPSVKLFKALRFRLLNKYSNDRIIREDIYNPNSEAFEITKKIFDEFYSLCLKNNSLPVVLILPGKDDVLNFKRKNKKVYSPLIDYFKTKNFRYLDISDALKEVDNLNSLFKLHYSELGNEVVAIVIYKYLEKNNLLKPESIKEKIQAALREY